MKVLETSILDLPFLCWFFYLSPSRRRAISCALLYMDFALEVFELLLFELKERGLTNSINDPGISPYYYLKSLHKLCNLRVAIVFCSSAQSFSFHKISSCAKGTT